MKISTISASGLLRRSLKWSLFITVLFVLATICLAKYNPRRQPVKIVQLPQPLSTGEISFERILAKRRSVRSFTSQPLDFMQIGQLAWAGQGITDEQTGFRTAPSAGAIYPIELYIATENGVFVYKPKAHSLQQISDQDIRDRLAAAALDQQAVAQAACDIIIAGSVKKLAAKYGGRAKRFMLLESGHIAQNIQLQAVSLGLGSVPIGAFDISSVRKVCQIPMSLEPVYIIPVGYPAAVTIEPENIIEKQSVERLGR